MRTQRIAVFHTRKATTLGYRELQSYLESPQPTVQFVALETLPQLCANRGAVLDIDDGKKRICAIPELCVQLRLPSVALEPLLVCRAPVVQKSGSRKSSRVTPDGGQTIGRLIDELAQVVFPTPVEVT